MTAVAGREPPLPLLTAAEMQAWDAYAIDTLSVPARLLMENAGRAAAYVAARLYPRGALVAAVGGGNNGGDAVVMLRTLRAWGREVAAMPVGSAGISADLLRCWEIPIVGDLAGAAGGAAVVIDGVLGTGARGEPRDAAAAAVRAMNASGRPVLALDGPTGIDLSDGSMPGDAVRADVTITFGAPKRGLLLHPGRVHAGRIVTVEMGFPPLPRGGAAAALVTDGWAADRLPHLRPDAHKGTAGEVLVVAGGTGTAGAAIMVAMGALRSGAGLARIASPAANRLAIHAAVPEAVFVPIDGEPGGDGDDGYHRDKDSSGHARRGGPAGIREALSRAGSAVIGPGTGVDGRAREILEHVISARLPLVIDADGLTLLAAEPGMLGDPGGRVLLTPHPGEMARLLRTDVAAVTRDPIGAAGRAAERFGCAVLLKGAPSVVAAPGEQVLVNTTGHSGVATGGMGDTLAGVAGALLAAGAPPLEAGALALHFAGRAAEIAGRGRALLPRDVAEALPASLRGTALAPPVPGVLLDLPPAR